MHADGPHERGVELATRSSSRSTARRSSAAPTRRSSRPPSARRRDPAPLLHGGHARRRQLPRLHGRDQGRARAGAVLLPLSQGRAWRSPPTARARVDQPEDVDRAAALGHARDVLHAQLRARPLGEEAGRRQAALRARASSRPRTSRIRRWPSTSTPASSARAACAPAARSRSTTSSATRSAAATRRSCSTSTTRWATPPASPAASACRRARPAR